MSNKLVNTVAAKSMSEMYLKSELADVHFEFPNDGQSEKVPAHRVILASTSPVFKAMFYGPLKESETVKIADSNADAFKEFLQLFYLFEITLSMENIEEIVRLADKYDMVETCATLVEANLTTENILWCYQFAIALNNAELKEFCEKHIQKHAYEIIISEKFLHCSHEVVANILKLDTMDCDEIQLFNASIKWAKASCQNKGLDETNSENLKDQLGSGFYSIRFSAMEAEELAHILQIKLIEGLFKREELADIRRMKWSKTPEPKLFNHTPRSKPEYTWNANKILVGNRVSEPTSEDHTIEREESVWFSSNKLILLGKIHFISIFGYDYTLKDEYCGDPYLIDDRFKIDIVEHNRDDFGGDTLTKSLYTETFKYPRSSLIMYTPIVIRLHKIYEIRVTCFDDRLDAHHDYKWVSEALLDDKIKITFHTRGSNRAGYVSKLKFNRID